MSDYGKGQHNKGEETYVFPGSSDARQRDRYSRDMYDSMGPMTGYDKPVKTKKNRTGSGAPNTGIQGSQERGNKMQTQNRNESVRPRNKSYASHYGGAAGKTSNGSDMQHGEYDYGKGRMKKGDKRRHVKAQGA